MRSKTALSCLKIIFSIHFITTDVKAIGLRSFNSVTFSFFVAQV